MKYSFIHSFVHRTRNRVDSIHQVAHADGVAGDSFSFNRGRLCCPDKPLRAAILPAGHPVLLARSDQDYRRGIVYLEEKRHLYNLQKIYRFRWRMDTDDPS